VSDSFSEMNVDLDKNPADLQFIDGVGLELDFIIFD